MAMGSILSDVNKQKWLTCKHAQIIMPVKRRVLVITLVSITQFNAPLPERSQHLKLSSDAHLPTPLFPR